jgi:hypothetical protein
LLHTAGFVIYGFPHFPASEEVVITAPDLTPDPALENCCARGSERAAISSHSLDGDIHLLHPATESNPVRKVHRDGLLGYTLFSIG